MLLALAGVLLLFALPVKAQTADTNPWYSPNNLTIAAGAGYQWWGTTQNAETIDPHKEWVVGLYNAWTLSTHLDATLTVEYGLDSKQVPVKVGLRYILKAPK
jgi:hypothetical protein